jgi:hypothetical protein
LQIVPCCPEVFFTSVCRGLNFGIYPPPWWSRKISANVIRGKDMKRGKEKEGKCKRKRKKGVEKRRKGERKILFSEGGKGIKYHFLIQI